MQHLWAPFPLALMSVVRAQSRMMNNQQGLGIVISELHDEAEDQNSNFGKNNC